MKITFYVLNDVLNNMQTSSDPKRLEEDFLAFVCKLTQTVLSKNKQTLIILDDDPNRLSELDRQLWSFSSTSFIPHDLCLLKSGAESESGLANSTGDSKAPVILTDKLPTGFDGVVLNLARKPLNLAPVFDNNKNNSSESSDSTNLDCPSRLLEIIPADETNKQKGRDKYSHYRELGYPLELHKIS